MLDDIRNKAQSFGVKLIFGIIIIVFVFWGVGNMGGMSSDSLAVVNGEKISIREYAKIWERVAREERKNNPAIFEDEEAVKQYKRMVLDELISARLFLQEAERLGIAVTPHEIRIVVDTYNEFQDDNGKFNPDRYRQMVAALGLTQGEFESDLRQELLRNKLVRYLGMSAGLSEKETEQVYGFRLEKRPVEYVLFTVADYAKSAEVNDDEIAAYYEQNKEQFRLPVRADVEYLALTPDTLAAGYAVEEEAVKEYYDAHRAEYHRPASFQARHILILAPAEGSAEPAAKEALAKAEEKLNAVVAGLGKGEDFAALAKQYSDDIYSADIGGMLSWINAGESGSQEIEELAFSLEPGEVSEPFRQEQGWHILKLEDKKEARDLPLDEVRDEITLALGRQKAEADFNAVQAAAEDGLTMGVAFADLAAKFHIALQETGLVPQDDLENRLGVQSDSRQMLVDAIAAVVVDGSASTIPVPLNIERGIALVRIKEGRASEIPALSEVGASIRNFLQQEKGLVLARGAAEEALPAFAGPDVPEAFKGKVQKSARPVVRVSPAVEPLGPAPALVGDLFTAPAGKWLPAVYDTPAGVVIARVAAVEPVSDEEWKTYGPSFVTRYRQYWSGQAVRAFLYSLHDAAKVEVSLELLDRLNVR